MKSAPLFACALFAGFAAPPAIAQPTIEPLTIGVSLIVSTHDSERRLNVVLPRGYEDTDQRYPLVLVLDGGTGQDFFLTLGLERWNQLWGRSQPAIFVGVETVDRQRELLPPTTVKAEADRFPTAGESDEFRRWLAKEVLPNLRSTYRASDRAYLVGESAAGHFVAETWVTMPDLFSGYAALSPSLQWNGQSLSRRFANMPGKSRPALFISLANEGEETEEGMERFLTAAGESACFADKRDSHVRHSNTMHQLLPEALQFLLPTKADWLEEFGMTISCEPKELFPE